MSSAAATGKPTTGLRQVELAIQGMTCAACAARVEKKLGELDDVTATVNFATEKATAIMPRSVPVERLIEAVQQAGYNAELASPPRGAGDDGVETPGGDVRDAARVAYLRRRLAILRWSPRAPWTPCCSTRPGR